MSINPVAGSANPPESPHGAVKEKTLLAILRDYLVVMGALLYIQGWAYLASYVRQFSVSQRQIGLSLEQTMASGIDVLIRRPTAILVGLTLILSLAWIEQWRRSRPLLMYVPVILLSVTLLFAYFDAVSLAAKDFCEVRKNQSASHVTFTFAGTDIPLATGLADANKTNSLMLLFTTAEDYVVLYQPVDDKNPTLPLDARVYFLPRSVVTSATIVTEFR